MAHKHHLAKNLKRIIVAIMAFALHSCVHEYPEVTADGTLGVDPSNVKVEISVSLDLIPKEHENLAKVSFSNGSEDKDGMQYRFIFHAWSEDGSVVEKVIAIDPSEKEQITLPLNLSLQAKKYDIIIWGDIVKKSTLADYNFNTSKITEIYASKSEYRGADGYKDCLYVTTEIDLTKYSNQLNTSHKENIHLSRPMAAYEIYGEDCDKFLAENNEGEYRVKCTYTNFVPTAIDLLTNTPLEAAVNISYSQNIRIDRDFNGLLASDFIFAGKMDLETTIAIEIFNSSEKRVLTVGNITIPSSQNQLTKITTSLNPNQTTTGGAINIDSTFNGTIDVDLDSFIGNN